MCSLFSDYSRLIYPLYFSSSFGREKTDVALVERSGRIMFENYILGTCNSGLTAKCSPKALLIMVMPQTSSIQFCFYWSSIIEYAADIKQLWSRRLVLPSGALNPCSSAPQLCASEILLRRQASQKISHLPHQISVPSSLTSNRVLEWENVYWR